MKLKPCPFCGGRAVKCTTSEDGVYVKCSDCNASSSLNFAGNDFHIKAWNTRTHDREAILDEVMELFQDDDNAYMYTTEQVRKRISRLKEGK